MFEEMDIEKLSMWKGIIEDRVKYYEREVTDYATVNGMNKLLEMSNETRRNYDMIKKYRPVLFQINAAIEKKIDELIDELNK